VSLTIGRLHRRTLIGTASLGTLGVAGGSIVVGGAIVLSLVSMLYGAIDLHDVNRSATRRWLVHGITVILLLATLLLIGQLKIDAVFIILMLGLTNRVLLRASSRDDVLIVGGAAVLLTAATVVTSGLGFAVLLFATVPCAAAALWTSTMLASAEHLPAELSRLRARTAPSGALLLGFGALVLTLAGFGVSTMLPRYRFTPFLAAGALGSLPGADDSMRLTNAGVTDIDDAQVVLRLIPGDGVDEGMTEGLYARLYSLDEFDGRTWSSRTGGHFTPSQRMDVLMEGKPSARVQLTRLTKNGPHHPVAVFGRTEPWAAFGSGAITNLHFDLSGTMVVDGFPTRVLEYTSAFGVPLPPPPRRAGGLAAKDPEQRIALPESLDPRVRALGEQLAAGKTTEPEKIAAVLAHFDTGFTYSTEPLQGTSEDPLARFLFESKTGHCELYAGATATLLRIAGVESRVATGYYLGRWNDLGEYRAFSQSDAHAWVEVMTNGNWRWIDATPEGERGRRDESIFRRMRDWYDVASGLWFDNVVDYDSKRQQEFYMKISRALERQIDALAHDPSRSVRELGSLLSGQAQDVPSWVFAPLALIGLGAGAFSLRKRRSPEGLGRRLRKALGAEKNENLPLGTLVKRAGRGAEAVSLYERLRFAPKDAQPHKRDVVLAIRALEKSLAS